MSSSAVVTRKPLEEYARGGVAYVNLVAELIRVRANGLRFSFSQRVNDALFGEDGWGDWSLVSMRLAQICLAL